MKNAFVRGMAKLGVNLAFVSALIGGVAAVPTAVSYVAATPVAHATVGGHTYAKARETALGAGLNLTTATVKASLVSSSYTPNLTTDQFYSSVSGVIATSSALTTKTVTGGVFNADAVTYSSVTSGSTGVAVVVWIDTGTSSTSPLLSYSDVYTGLPVITNGGNIVITWDSGSNKIFAI